MKKILFLVLLSTLCLSAKLNIAVSYPYIGALVDEIAKDKVKVTVLAKGNWDPHFVIPKPSLISKLRRSDALIMNGAQLEIGWLPPLLNRASNQKVQANASTFLNLSHQIKMLQVPRSVDRSLGDIHPDGNPHFHLDPRNILILAKSISRFMGKIDPKNKATYSKNLKVFSKKWKSNIARWKKSMAKKKGMKVIQFHDNFAYFNNAYGLKNIAMIEPLPGISPSSRHTLKLISLIKKEKPRCIMHDVYHSTKTAKFLKSKTGIKVIVLPHDVHSLKSIDSLKKLFDVLVQKMSHA